MTEWTWRSFEGADFEIRSDGRTVYGLMAPFNSPTHIREFDPKKRAVVEYEEQFQPGAFLRTINSGRTIPGYVEHEHRIGRRPIGAVRNLSEQSVGLVGEIYVSDTQDGNDALTLVRDGAFGAFSIGFAPVKGKDIWTKDRSAVTRTEVKLGEVSIVARPAYEGAIIDGVRTIDNTWLNTTTSTSTSFTLRTPDEDSQGLEEDHDPDSQTHSGLTIWQARARLFDLENRNQ